MSQSRIAIYAGTFDPLTWGHYDLIRRSVSLFDRLILAVARSTPKDPLFSTKEREELTREAVKDLPTVEVVLFEGLLINYARSRHVRVLVRGLRAFSDFEYEFQMALINRKLAPEIETLFMMPSEEHSYLSSSRVKELVALGGDVSDFVPPVIRTALLRKYNRAG